MFCFPVCPVRPICSLTHLLYRPFLPLYYSKPAPCCSPAPTRPRAQAPKPGYRATNRPTLGCTTYAPAHLPADASATARVSYVGRVPTYLPRETRETCAITCHRPPDICRLRLRLMRVRVRVQMQMQM
ncbi:hypothetical protein BKA80DRAFT_283699 [Phyllosticta citrichinensis]